MDARCHSRNPGIFIFVNHILGIFPFSRGCLALISRSKRYAMDSESAQCLIWDAFAKLVKSYNTEG